MSYIENLEKQLFEMQDLKYRDFHSKLLPGIDRETIIGIRTPMLRKFTKEFAETLGAELFLKDLPHRYYEENNMHMMIISWIKDYEVCLKEVKKLLPYVNNWATCDLPAPKCFAKHKEELLPEIRNWIASGATYTIRYGIGMLMRLFLDEDFSSEYLEMTAAVQSQEYYVNMMIAWYFATLLAKQPDCAVKYLENRSFLPDVHKKTVRKAIESFRVSAEMKAYLRTL